MKPIIITSSISVFVVVFIMLLIYATFQYVRKTEASNPQVQMACDKVADTESSNTLYSNGVIDLSKSLVPFIVFCNGKPQSTQALDL